MHRLPMRVKFSVRMTDVAESVNPWGSIVNPRLGYEARAVASEKNTAEVLAIVIPQELGIPRPRRLCQLAAQEPRSRLHVEIQFHLAEKPFYGREVAP